MLVFASMRRERVLSEKTENRKNGLLLLFAANNNEFFMLAC